MHQLLALRKNYSERVATLDVEIMSSTDEYQVLQAEQGVARQAHITEKLALWLQGVLKELCRRRGFARQQEITFRKARHATANIRTRQLLVKPQSKIRSLFYLTPGRRNAEAELIKLTRLTKAARHEFGLANNASQTVAMRVENARQELLEIEETLLSVTYKAERAYRNANINRKKGFLKVVQEEEAALEEFKAEEDALRERKRDLDEQTVLSTAELAKLQAKTDEALELLHLAEGDEAIAQAKVEAAHAEEGAAQLKAEQKLLQLESEDGIVFGGAGASEQEQADAKNVFKALLMRKLLDGSLETPWTPEDERQFRALFTKGLGGERKSEAAAEMREKQDSLLGRLGGFPTESLQAV